jgi:hypothetical protein
VQLDKTKNIEQKIDEPVAIDVSKGISIQPQLVPNLSIAQPQPTSMGAPSMEQILRTLED